MLIKDLIEATFAKTVELWGEPVEGMAPKLWPPEPMGQGVPTMAPWVNRPYSPMLRERFEICGRWTIAAHGHWLSTVDMEALWSDEKTAADPLLEGVREQQVAGMENWANEASSLFGPERLSLFAGSDYTYEKVYLLWVDYKPEPELWVYDANGESRYRDLAAYLQAYLDDDVSAANNTWRA